MHPPGKWTTCRSSPHPFWGRVTNVQLKFRWKKKKKKAYMLEQPAEESADSTHVRMHESMPDVLTEAAEEVLLLCAETAPAMAARTTAFLKSMATMMTGSKQEKERLRMLDDSKALSLYRRHRHQYKRNDDRHHPHMAPAPVHYY